MLRWLVSSSMGHDGEFNFVCGEKIKKIEKLLSDKL